MRADIHDGPEQMLQSKAGYIDARPLTASSAKPLATHGRTIHLGQSRHLDRASLTSGLPRLTDIARVSRHVPKVPCVDPPAGHHGNLSNWGRPSHISSQGAFEPTKI